MNSEHEHAYASGGEPGVGERLRKARVAAGLSVDDVASKLKMPHRVVEAMEAEDWKRLGAPVYVRGQLRSYSRLLGLVTSTTLAASGVAPIEPTPIVARSYTPRMTRWFEQGKRRLVYIILTAALVVPAWLATKPHIMGRTDPATVQSLDAPVTGTPLGRCDQRAGAGRERTHRRRLDDAQSLAASGGEVHARAAPDRRQLGAGAGTGRPHDRERPDVGGHHAFLCRRRSRPRHAGQRIGGGGQQGDRPQDLTPYQRANVRALYGIL
jgi:cytoskeleton protein RodZ